uniref:GCN5-related N-acetyltransferase domain containing protein n=1 Tax=Haemonchus contortus TaxID=6289 RepID=W6NFD3_HAECO
MLNGNADNGMTVDRYSLIPLYNRQDLNEKCIKLLNQEWPRSDGAREHSQAKSCRLTPPMSFLLIENSTDRLIGHARICLLPNRPTACWIESVIVEKECRGLGIGKLLMAYVEDAAKGFGFDEAYLSTDDQVIFYERCGYEKCDPILHSTTATSVFPVPKLADPQPPEKRSKPRPENLSKSCTTEASLQSKTPSTQPATATQAAQAPPIPVPAPPTPVPPPPPGPPKKVPTAPVSTEDHQYMRKKLM